jgi:hypothetical protein
MGANHLIAVTAALLLQSTPSSTTAQANQIPQPSDTLWNDDSHSGFGFERLSDLAQYNRVQGLSLGAGYRVPLLGSHINLYGTVRYGLSDERITGRLSVVHDADRRRFTLSGYSDVADVDPFSTGRNLTNSFNALFVAHDNGDYLLARGGAARLETGIGSGLDLALSAGVERHSTLRQVAESEVNDFLGGSGSFPENPPVREETFGLVSAGLSSRRRTHWDITVDLMVGAGQATPRLFGDFRRSFGWRRGITLRGKAGTGTRPGLPQTLFRLGGLNTVRGFEYGTVRSQAMWAVQLDLAPLGGRVRPVAFLDAGQGAEISGLFSSTALVGGGMGLSLFSGLIRLDFSHPISPDAGGKVRFDIVVQGVR